MSKVIYEERFLACGASTKADQFSLSICFEQSEDLVSANR